MDATLFARAAKVVSPDKALRVARAKGYPNEVWWLIACFVGMITVFQLGSWLVSTLFRLKKSSSAGDAEAGISQANGRFSLRRIPEAIVNTYRVLAFRWTIQVGSSYTLNLAEVVVTFGYIIALFVWEFINTTDAEGVKYDLSYWGNRAGTIAASQFPLVTALGTKNNVIAYITGISYDKLNYVHRMTARVVFALLWVHSGNKVPYSSVWSNYPFFFIPVGLLAMVAFTILCIVSLRPIRSNAYEIFFVMHFLMVLILLLGAYFHTREEKMGYYIWPSFLVWALDRFIRVVRVVVFNHLYFSWTEKKAQLDATVELLSPHFVRLRLSRPPHFHWSAGQTAYIIMPTVSTLPTEAHPFTIASIESQEGGPDTSEEKKLGDSAPYWRELVFLINVREGFTKRLANTARKGERVKVLIDGPYGFTPNLDNDDTVVLVAGGSGVSYTLSTFLSVVNNVRAGKSVCRKVVWIWAIRDASHIDWVSRALTQALELAPGYLSVNIWIYITSGEPLPVTNQQAYDDDSVHNGPGSNSGEKSTAVVSLLDYSAIQLNSGRPDLHALLRDEVAQNSRTMSVTVCGSQAIARACRSALRFPVSSPKNILKGGPNVKLHVESFGYA
ncbi:iron reductase [Wolfiporia cocos MD-104 SS10]|uniref:ferric-chelate reductase (NADPH) n=1 Tax=Wolfiporia cocos (strain MD-104) TaxID=742152 RepID=A0A2H3J4H1_WOLCO|nr:iron reductase [Wolfiporia cocos MD-104 SS10]